MVKKDKPSVLRNERRMARHERIFMYILKICEINHHIVIYALEK